MSEQNLETYIEEIVYKCVKRAFDKFNPQISNTVSDDEKLMAIEDLINYLPEKPAKQTVYGWVNSRAIPYEKHGKRLYFRKSRIDSWLDKGRHNS